MLTGGESWFIYLYQYNKMLVLDTDYGEEWLEDSHFQKKTVFAIFVNRKGPK